MRLFAAVQPPAEAVEHLDDAVCAARVAHPDLQWVPSERWHLTVAFYGEVAEGEVARLRRRIGRAARAAGPLNLRFVSSGRFGDRVLWVGVAGDRAGLRSLARGVALDQKPYRPHLTVARVRRGGDPRAAAQALSAYDGPGWTAGEVLLVRSHLGPKPRHEPVGAWALGAGSLGAAGDGPGAD